jgi:glutamine phosphoribosylpyrophosphate amidotransferase
LLNVFAHELHELGKLRPTYEDIFKAITGVHKRIRGGYAVVAMIANYGVLAFRDPNGIRPLVFGKRTTASMTVRTHEVAGFLEGPHPGVALVSGSAVTRHNTSVKHVLVSLSVGSLVSSLLVQVLERHGTLRR